MSSGFGDQEYDAGDPPASAAAPGWYPSPDGQQRYWDGTSWSEAAAAGPAGVQGFQNQNFDAQGYGTAAVTSDERTMAVIAHASGILTGFVVPLIIWAIKKDESPFIKHHATEALNFQLTLMIGYVISIALSIVFIGLLLLPFLLLAQFLFPVLALIKANNNEPYRYPISIRMVS